MAGGAVILLLIGVGLGFSIGRFTAPRVVVKVPVPVTQAETTTPGAIAETTASADASSTGDALSADTGVTDETSPSADTTLPDTVQPPEPKQLSPSNGAVIRASRVMLRWSTVEDDSGVPVTYAFEIQNRHPGGVYGSTQVIKGLATTSFSARTMVVRRRWRVWAVDGAGNASTKSPWRTYIRTVVAPNSSTNGLPTSSPDTSSTTQ